MADPSISIAVDAATAQTYSAMAESDQKKVQILLNLRIQELVNEPKVSLKDLMDEIGANAEARGLTPEILEQLLRDD